MFNQPPMLMRCGHVIPGESFIGLYWKANNVKGNG